MALVSVIIPSYNRERMLCDAIESVLRQTLSAFEVLVVDDGSTDGTEVVVETIAQRDRRVRYVKKTNGGVASARNTGVAESAFGKYVAFLDSDDLWVEAHLERSISVLEANCGVSLVFGRRIFTDVCGTLARDNSISVFEQQFANIRSRGTALGKGEGVYLLPASTCRQALLRSEFAPWTSSVVVRRALVEREEWFDRQLEVLEDVDFFLDLSEHPFALIDQVAGEYRYHGDNLTAARDLGSPVTLRRQRAVRAFQRKKLERCKTVNERRFVRREIAATAYLIGQCCVEQGDLRSARSSYVEALRNGLLWAALKGVIRTLTAFPSQAKRKSSTS